MEKIKDPPRTVNWIQVNPSNPDLEKFPLFRHTKPVTVTVHAGETLYLPAMWYHKVVESFFGGLLFVSSTRERSNVKQVE